MFIYNSNCEKKVILLMIPKRRKMELSCSKKTQTKNQT